jgi:hypothetical protein
MYLCRTATARGKAEQADYAAVCAREDAGEARACATQFAPDFGLSGEEEGGRGRGEAGHAYLASWLLQTHTWTCLIMDQITNRLQS